MIGKSEFEYVKFDGKFSSTTHIKSLKDGYHMLVKDVFQECNIDSWIVEYIHCFNFRQPHFINPFPVWSTKIYWLEDLVLLNIRKGFD